MSVRERKVGEAMQSEVVSLASGDRLDLAEDIMRLGRIRHMPVLEGQRLVGIVSSRDLLAASLSRVLEFEPLQRRTFLHSIEVREVMTSDVLTVGPDTLLREAAELMLKRQVGCLPVVSPEGELRGLLTETDLVRVAYLGPEDTGPELVIGDASAAGLERDLAGVRRLRDELRVQLHLGKAEVRERWEELEGRLREVEERVGRVMREAEEPVHEAAAALRGLLAELRDAYRRLRDTR
jgi:CBS domain-containing protein